MYSDEFVTYLYSYNMPAKGKQTKQEEKKIHTKNDTPLLHVLKSAYATMPMKFNHE